MREATNMDEAFGPDIPGQDQSGMLMSGKSNKAALILNREYLAKKKAEHERLKKAGLLERPPLPGGEITPAILGVPHELSLQEQVTKKVSKVVTKVIDKVVDKMVSDMEAKLSAAFGLEEDDDAEATDDRKEGGPEDRPELGEVPKVSGKSPSGRKQTKTDGEVKEEVREE